MFKQLFVLLIILSVSKISFGSELIEIKLYDGETTTGRLSLPMDNQNVKLLVIFVPGTGPNTYLNKRKIKDIEFNYYDLFADEFNKRDIGFFSYNTRGVKMGDKPPLYEKIDSTKYAEYLPSNEVKDVESIVVQLKKIKRLSHSKIVLLGWSEGTVIASIVADRKKVKIDALFLAGYANDNLYDAIKWQFSGKSSLINLCKYFDTNQDGVISKSEYESTGKETSQIRTKLFHNKGFQHFDINKNGVIDSGDLKSSLAASYGRLLRKINSNDDSWIWNNYFKVTSKWLKAEFKLEANKTRLLRINIPIYIFHGTDDASTPVEGVYNIRDSFKKAHKTNLHCYIFKGHDHDLNYLEWPFRGRISKGLAKIFNTGQSLIR